MYANERERAVDRRIAALELDVFGRVMGPDGTDVAKRKHDAERFTVEPGKPAPYQPPKPGVNRAPRITKESKG